MIGGRCAAQFLGVTISVDTRCTLRISKGGGSWLIAAASRCLALYMIFNARPIAAGHFLFSIRPDSPLLERRESTS